MKHYKVLGQLLSGYRERSALSMAAVADGLNVDRTLLSKIENGHIRPTSKMLEALANTYSLNPFEEAQAFQEAKYPFFIRGDARGREVNSKMEPNQINKLPVNPRGESVINVPDNVNVFYTDSVFITTTDFGVVFDFAQKIGPTNTQRVVSRIGLSKEHAKKFLEVLAKDLDRREKNMENKSATNSIN